MGYLYVRNSPMREQWERFSNSVEDRPDNCGPTAIAKALDYHRDRHHTIDSVRNATGIRNGPVTYSGDLKAMLAFGVSAYIAHPSVSELKQLIATGRRAVCIGVDCSQIPYAYRDHPFTGMHLITLMENDDAGVRYMDPNFNTFTGRVDPDRGYKFMPDWVLRKAFRHRFPDGSIGRGVAIIPTSPKPLPKPATPLPKPPVGQYVADGDPAPMRFRTLIDPNTGAAKLIKVKPGKPYRSGYLIGSPVKKYSNRTSGDAAVAVAYIDKDDLPVAERGWGDTYVVPSYLTNGDHFFYIKAVDATAR